MDELTYDIALAIGNYLTGETIVTGIVCNKCSLTLPAHTIDEHLNENHPIHQCPHDWLCLNTVKI